MGELDLRPQLACLPEDGDVEGLWRVIRTTPWSSLDFDEIFKLLQKACEVACRAEPIKFVEDIYGRMVGFVAYLLLRTQNVTAVLVDQHDRVCRSYGHHPWPEELTQRVLPQLMQLQNHFSEIAEHQARTARLWELTRRRKKQRRAQRRQTTPAERRTDPANDESVVREGQAVQRHAEGDES